MARDPLLKEAIRRERFCRENLSTALFAEYMNCDKKRIRGSLLIVLFFVLISVLLGFGAIHYARRIEKEHILSCGAVERFLVRKKEYGHQIITDETAEDGKIYHLDTGELGIKDLEEEYPYSMRFIFYVDGNGKTVRFLPEKEDDMPDTGGYVFGALVTCGVLACFGSGVGAGVCSVYGRAARREKALYLYALTRNPVVLSEDFRLKKYLSKEQKRYLRKLGVRMYLHLPVVIAGSCVAAANKEAGNSLMYFCGLGLTALGAAGMLKCGKKQEEYIESCFLAGHFYGAGCGQGEQDVK